MGPGNLLIQKMDPLLILPNPGPIQCDVHYLGIICGAHPPNFPGKGVGLGFSLSGPFGVWGTGSGPTRIGGFLTAYLRWFVNVGLQNEQHSHTSMLVRPFRCGVREKSLFKKRDPLRDPCLLCGGLRPRPCLTVK